MSHRPDTPLWLTFRGGAPSLGAAWLSWIVGATLFAWATREPFAEAGGVLPILVVGWLLSRHVPSPIEPFKRYHLDDTELTAMGPGHRVRRIAWAEVESVTQERQGLVVRGSGRTIRVPLHALRSVGGWGIVLVRVVPVVAARLWARLDRGSVHLRPRLDPPFGTTLLWAWVPALLTCVVAAGLRGAALAAAAAIAERVVGWVGARTHGLTLEPRGLTLHGRRTPRFVPWGDVMASATHEGLEVSRPGRDPETLPTSLRDYWAAAPVIELRAQLGPDCPGEVCFRARVDGGSLAVVGEIEAVH